MRVVQRWLLVLALLGVLGIALWVFLPQARQSLEPFLDVATWRSWRERIRSFGVLAPLVSIAISVAQIVPVPLPPPTIPLVNGWLFGPVGGTAITWLGVMLNGLLGYLLARGPGRRVLTLLVRPEHLKRAERALEAHGVWAILLARLIPVLPFSAISLSAGLLHVRFRDYLLANAVGILPSAFALALIGHQLSRGAVDWNQISLAVTIIVVLVMGGIPLARWLNSTD